ncbi:hypothetical protein F503_04205 [Ophiostoma piceae UAMH 11346]|uniref:J domain-containing protein n=1 Tax=Ophiostoma piceae (strain UAMH 11346) TaxID=1262450 RepID=S3CPW2_OPHP1|nr:hypothetical protein F503_04205 [Ophiostoma piceae UAMH 11346]
MADAQKNTITHPDQLLPNYYTTLSVPYNCSQEAIEAAFMSLTDDNHTFHKYKRIICDAFVCLASSGDRASYDAFYFHTPCWYSKALWLSYRDERRRLAWKYTAKINTSYLCDNQQAVYTALAEATRVGNVAANTLLNGHHDGNTEVASTGTTSGQLAGPTPSECAMNQARTWRCSMARQNELGENETRENGPTTEPNHAPDGGSDSGKSDNTWVNGGRAGLANGISGAAIATSSSSSTAKTTPFNERAKATLAALLAPGIPADDMGVMASQAVAIRPRLGTVPHKLSGSLNAVRPAAPVNRNGHILALASKPAAATAKNAAKDATATAPRIARVTASTATAMTASASSRARAAHGPAPAISKQLAPSRAHSLQNAHITTAAPPPIWGRASTLSRSAIPRKTSLPVPVKPRDTNTGLAAHMSADAMPSVASANAGIDTAATAAVANISATPLDKRPYLPPSKRGYLASSRCFIDKIIRRQWQWRAQS